MEREIKFEYLWSNPNKTDWIKQTFNLDQIESGDQFEVLSDNPLLKNYKRVARRQYTGLKDKNGKEIFGGDIVKFIDSMPVEPIENITAVKFLMEDGFMPYIYPFVNITSYNYKSRSFDGFSVSSKDCEVIGNIYENPELLERTNDK